MGTTHKKVKVVGQKTYIDQQTGELKDMQVIELEDRDFNFTKVWMQAIIVSLDIVGNQKTKVAFWIINHLDKENKLVMTQTQVAEAVGVSLKTTAETMRALVKANFLQRINVGAYRVNPDVVFKGTHKARMSVLFDYSKGQIAQQKHTEQTDIYDFIDGDDTDPKQQQKVAESSPPNPFALKQKK